jgi:hypothetical protein
MEKNKNNGAGGKGVATAQPSKNGTTANAEQFMDKQGVQPKAETPEVETKVEQKTEPKLELSVEDKIRKVELLSEAIEKRTLLKSHLARVEAMKFGDFEEKESLSINSQNGNYTIKSSSLIKEIAQLVKLRIGEQIVLVEEQINF